MSVEEVDSDEWEEWDEGEGIPPTTCLFCPRSSHDLAASLRHMTQEHSFFVPDAEFVTDMEGLVTYLGQKVCRQESGCEFQSRAQLYASCCEMVVVVFVA